MRQGKIIGMAVMLLALLLQASMAFGWGTDIPIWTGGNVNCFDVDYAMDGTMFVGFQAEGESIIRVYRSTDHGYNWSQINTILTNPTSGTTPRSDLKNLKVLYREQDNRVYIFWVDSKEQLNVSTMYSNGAGFGGSILDAGPVLEESLGATQNLQDGRMFVLWMEGTDAGDGKYIKYSDDGSTWNTSRYNYWGTGGNPLESIAYGPPDNIFYSYATLKYGGGGTTSDLLEIANVRSVDNGVAWSPSARITNNSFFDYNPIVAAANENNSGVWIAYGGASSGSGGQGVFFRYSADAGDNWSVEYTLYNDTTLATIAFLSDMKFYKGFPNKNINLVYTVGDLADGSTHAYWVWTSTGDPTNWKGDVEFNDQDIFIGRAWFVSKDRGPKIVYSPGASASGGGVVFSYSDGGLYFDAPWVASAPATYTLTVTVNGSGNVTSTPAGIDCTSNGVSGTQTCSHTFSSGEAVALVATAIDGTDYTSSFAGWSGACSGNGACVLTMNSDKTVVADFAALGTPISALPVPAGQDVFNYLPVETPVENPYAALCKPFGVGDVAGGTLSLRVGLPYFSDNVDIYLALYVPVIDPDNVYLITPTDIQPVSAGLTPWKTDTGGDIDESLFGDIPISGLPSGTYYLGVFVTPHGSLDNYYLWITYFVVP